MKFNLVEKRKTFYIRMLLMVLIFLTGFWGLAIYNIAGFLIPLLLLIPLVISPTYFYSKTGVIDVDENQITIVPYYGESVNFEMKDDYQFEIIYDSRRTDESMYKYSVRGTATDIFVHAGNEIIGGYKFIVRKNQREDFIELLKALYKAGAPLVEKDELGARCFLLQGNLKYDEIQQIKSEYNLTW